MIFGRAEWGHFLWFLGLRRGLPQTVD